MAMGGISLEGVCGKAPPVRRLMLAEALRLMPFLLEAPVSVLRLLRVVVLHMLVLPSRLLQQEGHHHVDRRRLRPLLDVHPCLVLEIST